MFTLLSNECLGQNLRSFGHRVDFKHYSNEQGFFSANIRNLYQDSKGRIWVCCQDGLSVFDGNTFYNFSAKDGFDIYDVGSVCEDNKGNMWVGTSEGLFIYKNKKFTRIDTVGNKLPRWITWSMYKDTDGTIWAGTHIFLFHLDPEKIDSPLIKRYRLADQKDRYGYLVRLVKRKKDGTLMVGTESTYFIQKGDTFVKETISPGQVYNLIEFENGKEWISGWGQPVRQLKDHKHDSTIAVGSGVLSLTKDKRGNVWLSTFENGLFKYNGKELINYSSHEGLNFNSFWSSLADAEGNVWFGSFGNGLYKYSGEGITSINTKNGLFNDVLVNMKQDTSGNVWMLSENSVSVYDQKLRSVTNYTNFNGLPMSALTNIEVTNNNEVYALAYGGNGYKFHNNKYTREPWLRGFSTAKTDSNHLYVVTEAGLEKWRTNGKGLHIQGKKTIDANTISIDKTGRLWIFNVFSGTQYYNGKNIFRFDEKNGFIRTPGNCAYSEVSDTVWIGTRGRGLYKCLISKDSIMKILDSITTKHGLFSDIINTIDVYKGKMYLGTAYGLAVMDMSDYRKGNKRIKMFTVEEGLVNSSCTVSFIDKDGKLWISTSKGAFVFDTNLQFFNDVEPTTRITNIQLHYRDTNWIDMGFYLDKDDLPIALRLPYYQNHFTFQFIGISHAAPTKVLYQYILQGLDEDWSPITNKNEITYSNIPPGTYTFMVKACNNDGVWNKEPTSFIFTITRPFWKTSWFAGLVIIFIGAVVYLFVRSRERKLKQEKLVLKNKVDERTSELKVALVQIEEKQKEIVDSIKYAKRLQKAILASEKTMKLVFEQSFILYRPKDIVSGDFYWILHIEDKHIKKNIFAFAAADCTGHGVPGAFMSMLNSTLLNQTAYNPDINTPADALNFLNKELPKNLRSSEDAENINDGMDIAFCVIDINKGILKYSGANNPCWIVRDNELIELKPIKQAITASIEYEKKTFYDEEFPLKKGDSIYIFTDGYADQFGGPKGKKFKYKTLSDVLLSVNEEPLEKQRQVLEKTFDDWKGTLEQVDDVLIMGIRI